MTEVFKPMLATAAKSIDSVEYPVLASPKLDGIRCLTPRGKPVSRNGKPIANDYIRAALEAMPHSHDLDGELVTLNDQGLIKPFNEVSGDIMRGGGEPSFQFLAFDYVGPGYNKMPFTRRYEILSAQLAHSVTVVPVPHVSVTSTAELEEYEQYCVDMGYEGVMIRDPEGRYKHGRSTVREGLLLKVKRFSDAEGTIVGFVEQMENTNAKDANGKRGMSQAGLVPKNTLGALILETAWGTLEVGTGFDDELRKKIWDGREDHLYLGTVVKFKYQASGMKDKPRFPVFLGFRHPDDMS